VRLLLRIDVQRRILAAGFELTHFEPARTLASALCDVLVGASIEDAQRTTAAAIARLAGLTDADAAARSVHFALQGALRPWLSAASPRGGDIVCACFALERGDIVETIRRHGLRTVEDLRARLPATRGCGTCLPDIEHLLRLESELTD